MIINIFKTVKWWVGGLNEIHCIHHFNNPSKITFSFKKTVLFIKIMNFANITILTTLMLTPDMLHWAAAKGRGVRGSGARSEGKDGVGEAEGVPMEAGRSRVRWRSH